MNEDEESIRIKNWLKTQKINLWEPPYTKDSKPVLDSLNNISTQVSQEIGSSVESCLQILHNLRQHALDNLAAKKLFDETKLATVKVKLPKQMSQSASMRDSEISFQLSLSSSTGRDLAGLLANQLALSPETIKVISSGRVLKDAVSLADQGIKNNARCIMLIAPESQLSQPCSPTDTDDVDAVQRAAQFLADKSTDSNYHTDKFDLQITDQSGKKLHLPNDEKKALTKALALHEKGKSVMLRKNFESALVFLLIADEEFRKCTGTILQAVDNFSLLQIDIVWCFLNLERITELQDAQHRLTECETGIKRCYGENFKRARRVNRTSGCAELVVVFRLHLLKAICAFHQNKIVLSKQLLTQAVTEFKELHVDDSKIQQIMELGFSSRKARIGLRSCNHNVEETIQYLFREKERLAEEKAKQKQIKELKKKWGTTADGTDILPSMVDTLVSMGFRYELSVEAIRQSNNEMESALQLLDEKTDSLQMELDKRSMKSLEGSTSTSSTQPNISKLEDLEMEQDVLNSLLPDVSNPDDHVDPDITQETQLLLRFAHLLEISHLLSDTQLVL